MAEQINKPPRLYGDPQEQIRQIWDYLAKTADVINYRLEGIGSNDLTDAEREIMRPVLQQEAGESSQMVTLKNMIVKTAEYIQNKGK